MPPLSGLLVQERFVAGAAVPREVSFLLFEKPRVREKSGCDELPELELLASGGGVHRRHARSFKVLDTHRCYEDTVEVEV